MLRTITPAFGVTAIQAATTACNLVNLQGYFRGSTDAWLQIHDAATTPDDAEASIPLKSFPLLAESAFSWKFDPSSLPLSEGMYVCVSDQEGYKDLSASTADFLIDVEEYEQPFADATTVPDTGTPETIQVLPIWAAGVIKKLLRVDVTSNAAAGTQLWLLICADSAYSKIVQALPLFTVATWSGGMPATYTRLTAATFRFGDGLTPFWTDGTTTYHGCYLAVSSAPDENTDNGDTYTILAYVR